MTQHNVAIQLSVIVPVGLRHSDLTSLHREYRNALEHTGFSYEIIYVLDGSLPEAASRA